MSSALAIAGVTAALRDLLNDGMIDNDVSAATGSTVSVSVGPPDRAIPASGAEATQLNLFMHSVSPNQGWRNEGLPAMGTDGRSAWDGPPLALDLHYWLSAYSGADLHGEILLGYAMQLLHQTPVLTRQALVNALQPAPVVSATLPPALRALDQTGLESQPEMLKITLRNPGLDELSKLWSATQSAFRPTAAYTVSVVLITPEPPSVRALPVLSRNIGVRPDVVPALPQLERVEGIAGEPATVLGDVVTLRGHHLDGAAHEVHLVNDRLGVDVLVDAGSVNDEAVTVQLDRAALAGVLPVGVYRLSVRLRRPTEVTPRETNRLALVVAPEVTNLPMIVNLGIGPTSITLDFVPERRAAQSVTLVLGTTEFLPEPAPGQVGSLDFLIVDAAPGQHLVRLRIDGIDSPIIDHAAAPPGFLPRTVTFV